uniref:ArsR family transcriptional regulator n=1 Tax=Fervidicoccus fontis TaxID=683846 RepID=A0A7J3ZMC8_9CREN
MEDILSSKGRVRVLRILYHFGEVNITKVVRESRLNHKSVVKHLQILVKAGIVSERTVGRSKLYSINFTNPKTIALRDILSVLEER